MMMMMMMMMRRLTMMFDGEDAAGYHAKDVGDIHQDADRDGHDVES